MSNDPRARYNSHVATSGVCIASSVARVRDYFVPGP